MKKLWLFRPSKAIFWFFLTTLMGSCTPITPAHQRVFTNQVLKTAQAHDFKRIVFQTPFFPLTVLSHIASHPSTPLIIYLEGDGHSYESPYRLSADPTPYRPLGLQLALKDPRPNKVYIARPGQYPDCTGGACDAKYWSTHRFSKEVIEATNQAIDFFKHQSQAPSIELIGFSGGGGLAVLSAAYRKDVCKIVTIAGDLDTLAMSVYHKTQLSLHSLNPIDIAPFISHIPQYHYIGKKDRIVPIEMAQGYLKASTDAKSFNNQGYVKVYLIDAFHQKGWLEKWPSLLLYFQ